MFHPAAALRGTDVNNMLRNDFLKMRQEIEKVEKLQNPVVLPEELKSAEPEIKQLTLV